MCFLLYAGTDRPLPTKEWKEDAPDICVQALSEDEQSVLVHFTKPVVQYIGSTAGCGCDFPSWTVHNPDPPDPKYEDREADRIAIHCRNTQSLADFLRTSGESSVELYGVWQGNEPLPSRGRQWISLQQIVERRFRFLEQVSYTVEIR